MHTEPSEVAAIDRSQVSADTVLNLLREYEETHESIAHRLLGRLIALDPDTAMSQLEAAKAHLDERMVRSAVPFSQALIDELARVSEATDLDQRSPSSLADAFPQEQARIRDLITAYRDLPNNAGAFGAAMLEDTLRRADQAAISGDVLAMLSSFAEMQELRREGSTSDRSGASPDPT